MIVNLIKMMNHLSPSSKQFIHLCALHFILLSYAYIFLYYGNITEVREDLDPWLEYGIPGTIGLYFIKLLVLLIVPQCLFNYLGLTLYNSFNTSIGLKSGAQLASFICFRVVTRGDYPELVKNNLKRNLKLCLDVGLENFTFEIATDKKLDIPPQNYIREILIPSEYRTSTNALFKARALQYCLEDDVNILAEKDWIVHLDEETLLTENSIRGIVNFVSSGKYEFGQGVITYANEEIKNWFTTLADSFRVAEDYGKIRFQFQMFHRPIFGIKGSYVVTHFKAEKDVSFDHGIDGSVAEDCYFSMMAYKKGYSFDFIEGEMWEKSPFNIRDFLQQRKRWLQGIWLVLHSSNIPFRNKCLLGCSLYSWVTLPLQCSNILFNYLFPLPPNHISFINLFCAFTAGISTYLYIFGAIKSFNIRRIGVSKFMTCLLFSVIAIPFNLILENIAVIWGIFGKKHKFYVVQKT